MSYGESQGNASKPDESESTAAGEEGTRPSRTGAAIRSLGVGLVIAGSAAGALANGGTITVREEVEVAATPAQAWAAIKDFQSWQTWHPAFASTKITKGSGNDVGTVRVLSTKDGAEFLEELVSYDPTSRSYQYRILKSPLTISGYVSTISVNDRMPGSRISWSSTFAVNEGASEAEIRKTISGVYRSGLDSLQKLK